MRLSIRMRKRAERLLKELYDKTERITEPEITPVLEGNCRIQGPVDELDHELCRTNSGIFPPEKKCAFMNKSLHVRGESGTCNICSAPCSSCLHNNQTVLAVELKMKCVSSSNSCATKEFDSCSFICADAMPHYKSRICDDSQHMANEASNLLSDSSSHDSYSDNAESKVTVRPSVTYEVPEDVDMPLFVASRESDEDQFLQEKRGAMGDCLFFSKSHITSDLGRRTYPKQDAKQQGKKCNGDNISCITGIKDSNIKVGHCNVDLGKNNATCSATTDAFLCSGVENTIQVEDTVCLCSSENNERLSNYNRPITCMKESFQKKCADNASPDKSDFAVVHVLKHSSPGVQFPLTPSQDGFIFCHDTDCKDLDGSSSCQLHIDGETTSGSKLAVPGSLDEKKPLPNLENFGFSTNVVKVTDPCLGTDNGLDKGISSCKVSEPSTINKEFEMPSSLVEASKPQELQVQLQQAMESGSSESEVELTDIKVCDICGDAGREELLAICSRCSDGAEHTYCMRVMLRKLPEGDWICEECQMMAKRPEKEDAERKKERPEKLSGAAIECMSKEDYEVKVDESQKVSPTEEGFMLKEYAEVKKGDRFEMAPGTLEECKQQDTESKRVDTFGTVTETPKLTSLNGTSLKFASASTSKIKPRLDMKVADRDVRRVPKGLQSPGISPKRHAESQEVISSNNKKPSEISGECIVMGSPRKKAALSRESSFKNLDTAKASGEYIEMGSPRKKPVLSRESLFKNLDKSKASAEGIEVGSPRKKPALSHTSSFRTSNTAKTSGEWIDIGSPKKKPALLRDNSFNNLDKGKARVTNIASPSQSLNSFKGFSRSQSMLGSHSSKVPAQLQPPSGLLSRSTSFNSIISKPKVKQLTESVPIKRKFSRESSLNITSKEALLRSTTKSASLKNFSSDQPNTESVRKTQFIFPTQVEDPKFLKQVTKRNMIVKKNSSMLDCPSTYLSPRAGPSTTISKMDMKTAGRDVKFNSTFESKNLNIVSESNILRMSKGSDDANGLGRREAKKLSTVSSKILQSTSLNAIVNEDQRLCQNPEDTAHRSTSSIEKPHNNSETVQHQGILQTAESTHRDDKSKDSSNVSTTRQAVSSGNQILHCQTCNITGHAAQFCSVDKLRLTALKPSLNKNPEDVNKKSSKWKDAVEATILKSRLQKNNRQSDQLEEFPVSIADANCEVASKVIQPSSSNLPRNISPTVETPGVQAISIGSEIETNKTAHATDMRLQSDLPVEASCTSRNAKTTEASCTPEANNLNATGAVSDELNVKYLLHMLPDEASVLANPYSTLAIPELEFIWQGSLDVLKNGNDPLPFDGIQAHLSTSASPKVPEVAAKIPCRIQLDEVSYVSSWPLQFQGISPSEHNIALFFFAKDIESYERSYCKLLENMIKNDLALRGIINGVELLIFPSTRLPVHSQRWNRLFFLWGIFKERRINSLKSKLSSQKKSSEPILNMDPAGQDLPCALSSVVSDSQKAISVESPEKSPSCVISPAAETLVSVEVLETSAISFPKDEDGICEVQESVVHNSSFLSACNKLQLEESASSIPVSSLSSTSQLSNLFNKHPKSRFDVANTSLCSEVKIDDTYMKTFGYDLEEGPVATASAEVPATTEQIDCMIGTDREIRSGKGLWEDILVKNVAIVCDDPRGNSPGIDHLISEERPNRKQAHSCSTESRASGETLQNTDETVLPKHEVTYLPTCLPTDDERERERMCFSKGYASGSFRQETLSMWSSSKVLPWLPSFPFIEATYDDISEVATLDESRSRTEKFFFQVEPSPVQNTKSDNLIHILSSDDEDDQESSTPNLELALGGKWKTQERQWKGPAEEDDDSASLSLSLAIPTQDKENSKPILKPEQHLQDRPEVSTELLLFGGLTDT